MGEEPSSLTWACVPPGNIAHCPGKVWAALDGDGRLLWTPPPVTVQSLRRETICLKEGRLSSRGPAFPSLALGPQIWGASRESGLAGYNRSYYYEFFLFLCNYNLEMNLWNACPERRDWVQDLAFARFWRSKCMIIAVWVIPFYISRKTDYWAWGCYLSVSPGCMILLTPHGCKWHRQCRLGLVAYAREAGRGLGLPKGPRHGRRSI